MDHKFDFGENSAPIVYVRPVPAADLPDEIRSQIGEAQVMYSVHDINGLRLALVADRNLAFALARQHDMQPVNVH